MSDPFRLDDPYGFDSVKFQLWTYDGVISPRLTMVEFSDEEIDSLPGSLPRLYRAFRGAKNDSEAREAAERFLLATEEYLDR